MNTDERPNPINVDEVRGLGDNMSTTDYPLTNIDEDESNDTGSIEILSDDDGDDQMMDDGENECSDDENETVWFND